MAEQAALSFGGLLRQLRAEARLTQEELAEAAKLSPRSVSDLERGINRTARKETADLLADALGLTGLTRELFVVAVLPRMCWPPGKAGGPPPAAGSHRWRVGARTGGCCLSASPMRRCSTGGSGCPLSWR